MILSRYQNAVQNDNLMIANKTFENVAEFEYFWMTVKGKI
jgi:hypothetical protein